MVIPLQVFEEPTECVDENPLKFGGGWAIGFSRCFLQRFQELDELIDLLSAKFLKLSAGHEFDIMSIGIKVFYGLKIRFLLFFLLVGKGHILFIVS